LARSCHLWSWQPTIVLGVLLAAVVYWTGLRRLAARGRPGRTVSSWHVGAFALGLAALVLALEGPLDVLSAYLLSVHMVQHLVLLMVAPVLLLLGKPVTVLLVGAPHGLVRGVARTHARTPWLRSLTHHLTAPVEAWLLSAGTMLVWHAPALYQAALLHQTIHDLEHVCFLVTGLLFWWVAIEPLPGPPRLHHGLRLLYTWSMTFPVTALGALLCLTNEQTPVYPVYAAVPRLWGSSVISDQQLGGIIIWLVGGMMYIIAASVLFFAMLAEDERRTRTVRRGTDESSEA
jgi:cytochrome c oxidase assembly factor CtaG